MDDSPPFYAFETPRDDKMIMKVKKPNKKAVGNPGHIKIVQVVVPGYIGKPEGLRQILFEPGLLSSEEMKLVEELRKLLGQCTDFATEIGMTEQVIVDRGHILLLSPECHPELSRLGIEY